MRDHRRLRAFDLSNHESLNPLTPRFGLNYPDFYVQAFGEFVGNGVGIGFGAGVADDDFDSVAGGVNKAAIAGWEGDGEEVRVSWFAESEGVALGVGSEATAEVAMEGFVLSEVDSWGLAVEADTANTAFFAKDGATNFVITVGAGGGGGLGEA
jgi:hypothetical protein